MSVSQEIYFDSQYATDGELTTHSKAALLAPILGVLALLSGMLVHYAVGYLLAVGAIVLGLQGWYVVRKYPREFRGLVTAMVGLIISGLALIASASAQVTYIYECPPDAERISFVELNPENKNAPAIPPKSAVALDGKKVFIKGYVYPDGQSDNIKQFVLIPDMGTCCFGGDPRPTDMVLVTLRDPHRISYNWNKRKLTGILKVDADLRPAKGVKGVFYQMDVESIQ